MYKGLLKRLIPLYKLVRGQLLKHYKQKNRERVSATDYSTLQQAINTGANELDLLGGAYTVTTALLFNQAGQKIKNGTLIFDGTTAARLAEISSNRVTFENVIFDGNDKQPRSGMVYVAPGVDRPVFRDCTFKKIKCTDYGTNVLNQTYAIVISPYAVTNFEIVDCIFKDLIKYNDNATNVPPAQLEGIGFIGGVCFMPETMLEPTDAQPIPTAGIISGCTFENIQTILAASLSIGDQATYSDADAIRTYGKTGGAEILNVHVSNCIFRNVSKRAFKFRAAGATANDCEIYADGMQYGMIVPIDVTSNSKIQNISIYASSSKPVQSGVNWSVGSDATQRETLIDGLYISHCIAGVGFFSDPTNQPLKNLVLRNVFINQASAYGIVQASPLPSTMENIFFENIQIYGSGNNCAGIETNGGLDAKSGVTLGNAYMRNGSIKIGGVNNNIKDVTIEIDSASYAGASAGEYLFRVGVNGYGGFQNVDNIFINAWNLDTGYLSASRQTLGVFIADNSMWSNIRVKVPEGLSQTYPHIEFWGNNWCLDGYTYDGAGMTWVGTTVAAVRWTMKNCVRLGSGASTSQFIYTNNAGTGLGVIADLTDFRPTTASSITINNGLGVGSRFVVSNVTSKTSNVTIVANGGLATVTNAINFP
jgi:hypothetical protein